MAASTTLEKFHGALEKHLPESFLVPIEVARGVTRETIDEVMGHIHQGLFH